MFKITRLTSILFAACLPLSEAHTNSVSGIYTGTIATKRVTVLIEKNPSQSIPLHGKYFYGNNTKEIALQIKTTKKGFSVTEKVGDKTTGNWELVYQRNKLIQTLSGTWKSPRNDKIYKILLRKIDLSAVVDTSIANIYESFKIKLNIRKGKTIQHTSDIAYRWHFSRTRMGQASIAYPYLLDHPNSNLIIANKIIEAHHRSTVLQALNCDKSFAEVKSKTKYGRFKQQVKVTLLTRKIFSIKASVSWICAGIAIGNNSSRSLTIDLTNGQIFSFAGYFNKKSGYGGEKDKIKILARKYFKRLPKKERDFSCLQYYTPLFDYTLSLAAKGLVFNLSLPRASAACIENVVIPYSAIRQYVKTKYRIIQY
ncbi:hypothetical protein MNBD_GAMMA12-1766 [hydrothermal vent metagenome]|uniref:Uncharacterized protein n=1 Tax=hydrothermal vent metagenome TaxID=652676 RepID=A0A3B0YU22_9ZZZZ